MEILESLFSVYDQTMSAHLRVNTTPKVKHGVPGDWQLSELSSNIMDKEDLIEYTSAIEDFAKNDEDTFYEETSEVYKVIQLGRYRIVITYPPFSDAMEITIVRPTISRILSEYNLDNKIRKRLENRAEGILIAGAPGHGKSTFASALANFYSSKSKIVKSIEKPRDLQLDDRVTQFTILPNDVEKVGDLLLLMRPDYVIFDEIRKNDDFTVYSDMRLAGVGMVGVIHATQPIDSIQRFVNRIELGLIPSIIDTVVFIKNGEVDDVLSLKMTVKTPHGFMDQSLARPVIEVREFTSKSPQFEIFSFGEQVVVIPLKGNSNKKSSQRRYNPKNIANIITANYSGIQNRDIKIDKIGKNLVRIGLPSEFVNQIENDYYIIQELEKAAKSSISIYSVNEEGIEYEIYQSKKSLVISVNKKYSNTVLNLHIGPQFIMRCNVNSHGEIILSRKKATTRRLEKLLDSADSDLSISLN